MHRPQVAVLVEVDSFFMADDVEVFEVDREPFVNPKWCPWDLPGEDHVVCFVEEGLQHSFDIFAFIHDGFPLVWGEVARLGNDLADVCFLIGEKHRVIVEDDDPDVEIFGVFKTERVRVRLVNLRDAEDDGVFYGVCQLDALQPELANARFETLELDVGRRSGFLPGRGDGACRNGQHRKKQEYTQTPAMFSFSVHLAL